MALKLTEREINTRLQKLRKAGAREQGTATRARTRTPRAAGNRGSPQAPDRGTPGDGLRQEARRRSSGCSGREASRQQSSNGEGAPITRLLPPSDSEE